MSAQRAKAFTLIEVLVVISIVALLMAILMPALAAARSQAREVVCSSNVRQLVLANTGYATENRGFYVPAASDMWNNSGRHRWHGIRDALGEPFDPRKGPLVSYLSDGRVKRCPAATDLVTGQSWSVNFEQGCGGYGYNMVYLGSRLWQEGYSYSNTEAYARTTTMSEVARPGETLMFADTAFYQHSRYLIEYSFAVPRYWVSNGRILSHSAPSPSIHFRHRARANIGWADGHTEIRSIADFAGDNDFYNECAAMRLGWFEPVDNSLFDLE